MIKGIIDLLKIDNFYGISKSIDIAKGYYSIPKSFSEGKKQLVRVIKSKK
jgi:hypothetical protein|tara:strand:- start:120 stop:269 length:150 start_codon:yes stop_codon:yes gene_type:complete